MNSRSSGNLFMVSFNSTKIYNNYKINKNITKSSKNYNLVVNKIIQSSGFLGIQMRNSKKLAIFVSLLKYAGFTVTLAKHTIA